MLTLIVVLFGVVSMSKLPVELYPNTSFGEISIIISARGGIPPSEVEDLITRLVEDGVSTVSNLEQILSISKEGESTVVLTFKSGVDMEFAALEVREKFAKIKNQLPKEIEKPVIAQFQQGDTPIVIASVTSEQRTTEEIRKIVDLTLKESLKRVSGVANVEIAGGRERKIMIEADQTRLASYGIPIDEVTGALSNNNLNLLSGEVERSRDKYLVRVIGEFESIEQIKNMGLRRTPEGSVIRVKDVAAVKDSYLEAQEYARLNVTPVVTAYVQKESTKNTITVARDILSEIDKLKDKLPRDMHVVVTSNQAEFIEKAIGNLKDSLFQGILLIILVFFVFLFKMNLKRILAVSVFIAAAMFMKSYPLYILALLICLAIVIVPKFRSIIIVTVPVPISAIGTFIFMQLTGLTINVMTLFGIALGVGMLVDNSIVVFENILKKRESGLDIGRSSIEGAGEMFLSIVASTLTNIIVFLPLVFMGEELQKLYSGMALTIVISLLISLVCAVSLVPMMCSRPILAGQISDQTEAARWVDDLGRSQRRLLFQTIRNKGWISAGAVLVLVASWLLMSRLGLEYLGSTEQNKFTTYVEMPTGTKLEISDKIVKKVEQIAQKVPEVKNVSSRIEPWSSKVYIELVPSTQRKRTVNDIIESIRSETSKLHPAFIYFQQEEQVGTKEVILELFGYNYEKLRGLAIAMSNKLGKIKGLSDAKIRMREGRPEMQILVRKKASGLHGIDVSQVANQVHGQMRGFRATVFHTEGKEVETITRLDEKYRKTFKDLYRLIMTTDNGDPILLQQLSDFKFGLGPSEIWRKNRNRMIQISANIGKIPLSKIVGDIKTAMKDIPFPEDYFYKVGGDYPKLIKTNKQMRMMILFVLVLIYLVLAALFESLAQPLLIMLAVPLALVGAVLALYLGPKSISIGALLGMMMLGGIVVNNSIMLMDRINHYTRERGMNPVKAAVLSTQDRLRPILMTFASTVLGLIPMAIDRSEGANLWSPLAITVIGGIVSSTFLTLLITPSFYIIYINVMRISRSACSSLMNKIFIITKIRAT